jgi:hypothetical protein
MHANKARHRLLASASIILLASAAVLGRLLVEGVEHLRIEQASS